MNIKSLAVALRNKAVELRNVNVATAQEDQTLRDAADLIRVLSCVAEGKSMAKAFGAPGDWGYETPIGAALYEPADIPELGAPLDQAAPPVTQERHVFWYRPRSDGGYDGPIHDSQIEQVRRESGAKVPLIAMPIQPAEAGD